MADYGKITSTHPSFAAALSVRRGASNGTAFPCASEACTRFLHAAAALPDEGVLGWQLAADDAREGDGLSALLFSSTGMSVTTEDAGWIFGSCAYAEPAGVEDVKDLFEGGRTVYRIVRSEKKTLGDGEDPEDADELALMEEEEQEPCARLYGPGEEKRQPSCSYFEKLLEILEEAGAVMQILAGPETEKGECGTILFSLPGEMPLRMRSALSLAFFGTEIRTVEEAAGSIPEEEALPYMFLREAMIGCLYILMKQAEEEKDRPGSDDSMTIDELELSVRAYSCLRRAGIQTVGQLRRLGREELLQIRNLGRKSTEEILQKLAFFPVQRQDCPAGNETAMEKLEKLAGLWEVKGQVRKIAAFARMKKDLEAQGGSIPMALNMEFVGNPGTAKTTVARIMAEIFRETGLFPGAKMVEVGRSSLIGKYVGHTAVKVREAFEQAKGGVLFIDEAYSLLDENEGSFGDEAINTIVQEMENHRADTVVIFAGYPDRMAEFFSRNPGLRSRVPFRICFPDYSAAELLQIAQLEASRRGFSIGSAAQEMMLEMFRTASGGVRSGNGRFCRNLVEQAILCFAERVYGEGAPAGRPAGLTLEAEDIRGCVIPVEEKRASTPGFRC